MSFTPAMRDRQARGKDPYAAGEFSSGASHPTAYLAHAHAHAHTTASSCSSCSSSSSSSSASSSFSLFENRRPLVFGWGPPASRMTTGYAEPLDFASNERRNTAAYYLDSSEMLMMYALAKGDSIQAVRLHFMMQLCGYDNGKAARDHRYNHYYNNNNNNSNSGSDAGAGFGAQRGGAPATPPMRGAETYRAGGTRSGGGESAVMGGRGMYD